MGRTDAGQAPARTSTISDITVANLRAEIARRGMNAQTFGHALGWSKNTTTRKLRGDSPLTINELDRAAVVLGVDLVALIAPPRPRQAAS